MLLTQNKRVTCVTCQSRIPAATATTLLRAQCDDRVHPIGATDADPAGGEADGVEAIDAAANVGTSRASIS